MIDNGVVEPTEEVSETKQPAMAIDVSTSKWIDEAVIEADQSAEPSKEQKNEEENNGAGAVIAPTHGVDLALTKVKQSLLSGLHCAVGEFEAALRLLHKQIALINPTPLQPAMRHIFVSNSFRVPLLPNSASLDFHLVDLAARPLVPIKLTLLQALLKVDAIEGHTVERNEQHHRGQIRRRP
jgi:hypothetical protein